MVKNNFIVVSLIKAIKAFFKLTYLYDMQVEKEEADSCWARTSEAETYEL